MATKWNSKVQFPSDSDYIARIIGASFGPANSGNPMVTLEWEIVSPAEREVAGEMYIVSGVKIKSYHVSSIKDDAEKTKKKKADIDKLFTSLGQDATALDYDNLPVKSLLKTQAYVLIEGEKTEKRKAPNADQLAKKQEGDIMKNPVTGQAMCDWWPKITDVFGVAEASVGGSGTPTV